MENDNTPAPEPTPSLVERLKVIKPHGYPCISIEFTTIEKIIARLEQLEAERDEYKKKYAAIVERCRVTPGRCFCGVHFSEAMSAPATNSRPALEPKGEQT